MRIVGDEEKADSMLIDFRQSIFEKGATYPASIAFLDGFILKTKMSALNTDVLSMDLSAHSGFYSLLKVHETFSIKIVDNVINFSLDGIDDAISQLSDCENENNFDRDMSYASATIENVTSGIGDFLSRIMPSSGDDKANNNDKIIEKDYPRRSKNPNPPFEQDNIFVSQSDNDGEISDINLTTEDFTKNDSEQNGSMKIVSPPVKIIKETKKAVLDMVGDEDISAEQDIMEDSEVIGFSSEVDKVTEIAQLKSQIDNLQNKIEEISQQSIDSNEVNAEEFDIKTELAHQKSVNQDMKDRISELLVEIDVLKSEKERLEKEMLKFVVATSDDEDVRTEIEILKSKLDAAEKANQRLNNEMKIMLSSNGEYSGEVGGNNADLQKRFKMAEGEVKRLGAMLEKERNQCQAEISRLERMAFFSKEDGYSSFAGKTIADNDRNSPAISEDSSYDVAEKIEPISIINPPNKSDDNKSDDDKSDDNKDVTAGNMSEIATFSGTEEKQEKTEQIRVNFDNDDMSSDHIFPELGGWNASAGTDMKTMLKLWSRKAGVSLVWKSPYSFPIRDDLSEQGSFEDAVREMLDQYKGKSPRPLGNIQIAKDTGSKILVINAR